ncbi:hypothetical protein OG895_17255 [Streptomyces sp. NBC_00201]|uniref:hypothetical protein n=1 Tax=Streptomyces sp. NBC_00201 TaxID=2975679 RepID=UPI00224D5945|nr:hypothetical protein [Streptomyces sp. NBC_00201]MCX5246958.1 hypothetical protein [Streptomyces sp. NBC_00201]
MRKLQQAMIAAAVAAGGLSVIGAGAGTAYAHDHGHDSVPKVAEHYRPYQECSPQTVAEGDLPIGVLGLSETFDTTCGQFNNAFTG